MRRPPAGCPPNTRPAPLSAAPRGSRRFACRPSTYPIPRRPPFGALLGAQSTATITITDNDIADGLNPIDTARFFVRLHYLDFLNREPDQSGWDFWTNNITNCAPQPSCTDIQRINTSAAYFLSIEFQQTGYLVERTYKAAFGDAPGASTFGGAHQLSVPILRLNEFLLDTQQIGQGVVVGQAGWETVLENNKQAYTLDFVQRARFSIAFPTTMTPTQLVNQLFTNAGVTPSNADRNAAIAEFGPATNTSDVMAPNFAALHNSNCRDAKSLSQELFGAAHHLSGLRGKAKTKHPINQ